MACRSERGFTLLEILVATTLIAIAFTTLFKLYGSTLRKLDISETYAQAAVVAESVMEQVIYGGPLEEKAVAGKSHDGRFEWRAEVVPYEQPIGREGMAEEYDEERLPEQYLVTVNVQWQEGGQARHVALHNVQTFLKETEASR